MTRIIDFSMSLVNLFGEGNFKVGLHTCKTIHRHIPKKGKSTFKTLRKPKVGNTQFLHKTRCETQI